MLLGACDGAPRAEPAKVAPPATEGIPPTPEPEPEGITTVAVGGLHACALDARGVVRCWGMGALGQLARAGRDRSGSPIEIGAMPAASALSAGRDLSCALDGAGRVRCWGEGPLGDPERGAAAEPTEVPGLTAAAQLDVSINHACAALLDGRAACWGSNVGGQLGDGTLEGEGRVVEVQGLSGVKAVAAGGAHSCALIEDGSVRCWGDNRFGQLGDGAASEDPRPLPAPVPGLAAVTQLEAGQFHTCARTAAGRVLCWGRNEAGQLGMGDRMQRVVPARLPLEGVEELALGQRHACARLRGGGVLCWGDNVEGQLGDGTRDDRDAPVPMAGLEGAVAGVAAGERQSCVWSAAGQVRCFGLAGWVRGGEPVAVLP